MKLNFTNTTPVNQNSPIGYVPDLQCSQWAIEQHITAYHNLETQAVLFVAGALLFLVAYEVCKEYPKLNKYADTMIYYSKLLLYIFFFIYIMVIKLQLLDYMRLI